MHRIHSVLMKKSTGVPVVLLPAIWFLPVSMMDAGWKSVVAHRLMTASTRRPAENIDQSAGSLPLASRACVVDEMTEPDPSKLELWLERDYIAKRGHNSLSITVDAVEFRAEMNAYVASQSRAWAKKKVSSAWLKLI